MTRRSLTIARRVTLVLSGCASWAWVAPLEGSVDAAAAAAYVDPRNGPDGIGHGELELLVLDLRLAPLLLAVAGVAVLVASSARSAGRALAVAGVAAVLLELVSAALPDGPGVAWVTALVLACAALTVVSGVRRRGRRRGTDAPGDARHVLGVVGIVLLVSQLTLVGFLPIGDWAVDSLPRGYVWAVAALQLLLTLGGMAALVLAARRLTGWHAGLGAVAVAALLVPGQDRSFLLAALTLILLTTAASIAGEDASSSRFGRPLGWGLVAAGTAPLVTILAFGLNIGLGAAALELNGGGIDVDGLPLFLSGPLAAVVPVALYLVTAGTPRDVTSTGVDGTGSTVPTVPSAGVS